MAYCKTEDINLGTMEPPRGTDVQKVINEAANDIDAVVGRFYRLPLQLSESDPQHAPYKLLLRKLNIFLTTGDIIIKAAGARQDDSMNASGLWYMRQAQDVLKKIENGKIRFPDQVRMNADEDMFTGPYASSRDSSSRVEDFYNNGWVPPHRIVQGPVTTWPQ
jgi:hypothetical protein